MDPNSAHHAKLYSLLDSFHGGSGEPLFMLYYEEWRGCGHYQSIEVDPNSTPKRVLQHLNWHLNKSVQQHSLPSVSSLSRLLPSIEDVPDVTPMSVTPMSVNPSIVPVVPAVL